MVVSRHPARDKIKVGRTVLLIVVYAKAPPAAAEAEILASLRRAQRQGERPATPWPHNLALDASGATLGKSAHLLHRRHASIPGEGGEQRPMRPAEIDGLLFGGAGQ